MNERIQDIATQAWKKTSDEVAYLNRIHNRSLGHDETMDIFEIKFAELIVRECAKFAYRYTSDVENVKEYNDVGWDCLPGDLRAEMKQHFGIEE